jgi:hypothetical protein
VVAYPLDQHRVHVFFEGLLHLLGAGLLLGCCCHTEVRLVYRMRVELLDGWLQISAKG